MNPTFKSGHWGHQKWVKDLVWLKKDRMNYVERSYMMLAHARACVCVCACVSACVCVCVCLFPSTVETSETKHKCNARDQVNDVVLRKLLCVKNLRCHVIDNHSRDLQASNCARVSVKPGGATRNKRQL